MTSASPVLNYPEQSAFKKMTNYIAKGTLVASYGITSFSNVPIAVEYANHYSSKVYDGVIKLLNGVEIPIPIGSSKTDIHHEDASSIKYAEDENNLFKAVLWTNQNEAIDLRNQNEAFFVHEKTVVSKIKSVGFYEPKVNIEVDADEFNWDDLGNDVFVFDKQVKSKIKDIGEVQFFTKLD